MDYTKKTCVSINCPFMGVCRSYNTKADRAGGCEVQDAILQASDKLIEQRKKEESREIEVFRVFVSERLKGGTTHSRSYYLHSLEAAREFMRESYEKTKKRGEFPADNESSDITEDEICVTFNGNSYTWKVSGQRKLTLADYHMNTSLIKVSSPSILRGWRVSFNDLATHAAAPANEFMDAFAREILPGTGDNWVLNQSDAERNIGYKSYEYKGESARNVVLAAANKLAVLLDTKVTYRQ